MSTITNLNHTTSDELRRLLEANYVTIEKAASDHFNIKCPECTESEAFIYFNKGTRNIECNRKNNCGEKIELWQHIANKQGIDANNNFEILKYINETLGYEFKQEHAECYNIEREERSKEQKFLADCNQIFFNTLNNNKDNEQVSFSLMYLQQRGYTEEYIKQFCLGFFPDYNDLLKSLAAYYNYSNSDAIELMTKYFKTILDNNGKPHHSEEYRHRITFTWHNSRGDIAGFSVRKPAKQNLKGKYYYNDDMKTGEVLFNLSDLNIRNKKALVVVEGVFDALTASYLSTEEVRQSYHFVACGKNTLSTEQALLLKNKGYSQVILFLDNDEAGKKFFSSVSKLREYDITSFVALIPDEYQEIKDIDELIRTNQEANLQAILDNAKYAINVQIDLIMKNNSKNHESLTDREKDTIITECSKLKPSLLMSEHEPYRKVMYEKLGIHVDNAEEIENLEQNTKQDTNNTNSNNLIKSELDKLKSDIILEINTAEGIDIHKYRHRIYEIKKSIIKNNPTVDNKSNPYLKDLNNITPNIKIYNDLLTINYEDDKPYSWGKYIQEIRSNPVGLQTGFRALDQYVTLQPASLVFIAGRPSHGKTTMMLNMLRNMIKANPDKSFLFYSYEEEKKAILSKIILANINLSNNEELIIDKEAEQHNNYRNKSYLEKLQIHLGKYDGTYCLNTKNDNSIITMSEIVYQAKKEVEEWINDGRLQILDRKPNVEILSSAIMERVSASEKEKPIVAIFIDYVQMLSTETERPTRQQELQKICSTLLDTSQDKRVKAAIILGAQANREVKSSDGFNLHNMKDAGDIEQTANLVLGVWNPLAEQMQMLQGAIDIAEMKIKLNDIFNKSEEYGDLSALLFDKIIPDTDINKLQNVIYRAKQKIKSIAKQKEQKLTIKILKNRNGLKDLDITLNTCLSRFLITDENNNTYAQQKM